MRPRHRTPSIFNLSMVDILCCSLGCVLLLWLLNSQKAQESARAAEENARKWGEKAKQLELAESEIVKLTAAGEELDRLLAAARDRQRGDRKNLADLRERLTALREGKAAVDRMLAERAKELVDLAKRLTAMTKAKTTLEENLRDKTTLLADRGKEADALARMLKAARAELSAEEAQSKSLKADLAKRVRELSDAGKRLEDLQAMRRNLERAMAAKGKELDAAMAYKTKLKEAEKEQKKLQTMLTQRVTDVLEAAKLIERLEGDRKKLQDETGRLRAAADQRFAGIALSGRRVIFLVDTSGSMDLLDEKTPAANKWAGVRAALGRIMRSLPDLEKFQVITFAEQPRYALGRDGAWIDYDPKASPERAMNALAQIKPTGGTNLYRALEAAFRHRPAGLDTVYLLSDGLPNEGPGLTPEQQRTLVDRTARSNLLSQHIRQTLLTDWNRAERGRRVQIHSVGFFYESLDLGSFLWALARENEGSFVGMSKP